MYLYPSHLFQKRFAVAQKWSTEDEKGIKCSQKVEATQMSIYRCIGKQNVVFTYSGILFGCKKEGNFDTCYHTDKTLRRYAK